MSGERHIELVWRCSACAHVNRGRDMTCQNCGDPKDAAEEYEMPSDTTATASVSDPKLLVMARAGEHWKCVYCGSHQRDLDGECARCGAGRRRARSAAPAMPRAARPVPWPLAAAAVGVAVAMLLVGTCVVTSRRSSSRPLTVASSEPVVVAPPTDLYATVRAAMWSRTVTFEEWRLVAHDGFTAELPTNAIGVKPAGVRVHHEEQVFDHDETVYDDVEVPDGFRTETYSAREECGEDCTPSTRSCRPVCKSLPQTCHEVCTNKKNGFASCHQECTGGGQSCHDECTGSERRCTTKYCDRTHTRSIPKTRIDRRPRVVKTYRSEPRTAPWSTFATWEWVAVRTAEDNGNADDLRWPDAGAVRDAGAERVTSRERLTVTLVYEDGRSVVYVPADTDELRGFRPGNRVLTHVDGDHVTVRGEPAPSEH